MRLRRVDVDADEVRQLERRAPDVRFAQLGADREHGVAGLQPRARGSEVEPRAERERVGGGVVYDFALADRSITQHPAAKVSAQVLRELMARDELNQSSPGDLVTNAMRDEIARRGGLGADALSKEEASRNYPEVSSLGRVIEAETRIVVVDERLKALLTERRT